MPLLDVRDLRVRYDKAVILAGVSLSVDAGEIVGVVGPNGAGKSTVLRAVSGLIALERRLARGTRGDIVLEGEIYFAGERIDGLEPHDIRRRGFALCPGRQRPFRDLTVRENLMAGAYLTGSRAAARARLERCYGLFPRLAERASQLAGTLSGGEQQMLAMARALMYEAKLLAIDEASIGLAPRVRAEVFETIARIHEAGVPLLVVEQEVGQIFRLAHRNYVLSQGRVWSHGRGDELLADESLRACYLGML